MNKPRTPAELKVAFISALDDQQRVDPLVLEAVTTLIEKIEDVYLGLSELSPIEQLFGRSLLELMEEEHS